MMYRKLFIAFFIVLLAGCSSIPETPVLNAKPINAAGKFSQYWITDKDNQNIFLSRRQQKLLRKHAVIVKATYLVDSNVVDSNVVDSNGNVYGVKITESNGEGLFAEKVKSSLQRRVYKPAKTNPERLPVYNSSEATFEVNKN